MDSTILIKVKSSLGEIIGPYWTETNVFYGVLIYSWLVFSWNFYLSWRQYRVYKKTEKVPKELDQILDLQTFVKARAYSIDKAKFSFISGFYDEIKGTLMLSLFLLPYMWQVSGKLCTYLGLDNSQSKDTKIYGEIYQSIIFSVVSSLVSLVTELPFSLYSTFVIEERHGFNKQTLKFYTKDTIKKFLVTFAISSPVIAAVVAIVRMGGDYFFFYLWLFVTAVTLILMAFTAEIAALFDKYTPLPESELREKIEKLASSIKFPLSQIYVVEGSARSSHSNAYFYGFFNRKRIVLYDTLIKNYEKAQEKEEAKEKEQGKDREKEQDQGKDKTPEDKGCEDEEILAVLGHELGHWYLNHVAKNIIFAEVNLLFMFCIFSQLYQNETLFRAFGFDSQRPVIIGLMFVLMYVFAPYNEIIGFITVSLSRRYEFQADRFAKDLGKAKELRSALIKLNKDNLGFPVYDPLYSQFNHSHPPLLERMRALDLKSE